MLSSGKIYVQLSRNFPHPISKGIPCVNATVASAMISPFFIKMWEEMIQRRLSCGCSGLRIFPHHNTTELNHDTIHIHYNIFMLCRRHRKCRYHYIYDYFIIQRVGGSREMSKFIRQPPPLALEFQCIFLSQLSRHHHYAREYSNRGEKNCCVT